MALNPQPLNRKPTPPEKQTTYLVVIAPPKRITRWSVQTGGKATSASHTSQSLSPPPWPNTNTKIITIITIITITTIIIIITIIKSIIKLRLIIIKII